MKTLLQKFFLLGILLFSSSSLFAQVEEFNMFQDSTVIVTMKNGEQFQGQILSKTDGTILLKTENGELKLIANKIRSIETVKYKGKYDFANPHATRYFFGPSGIAIEKGKGYYQNILVTTNFVNYGITDNISVGGGFEFLSTITGNPIWFFTPKVGFEVGKNMHAGGGIMLIGLANQGTASLGYGVFTYGGSESNVSVGLGYGFASGEVSSYPAIMISGTHRVSNSVALLSENYLIPNSFNTFYFGIQGVRLLSKNNAFDIGAIIIPEIGRFIPALPFVGYARAF